MKKAVGIVLVAMAMAVGVHGEDQVVDIEVTIPDANVAEMIEVINELPPLYEFSNVVSTNASGLSLPKHRRPSSGVSPWICWSTTGQGDFGNTVSVRSRTRCQSSRIKGGI